MGKCLVCLTDSIVTLCPDCSESLLEDIKEYVRGIECDTDDCFDFYPRNFYDYCENANCHSYDDDPIIEQYKICKEWDEYRARMWAKIIEN